MRFNQSKCYNYYADPDTLPTPTLPTGHFTNTHFTDKTLYRQDTLPTGHFTDRTLYRQDTLPTGHFTDRTLYRQSSKAFSPNCFSELELFSQFGLFNVFYIIRV